MGLDIYNTFQPEIYDVAGNERLVKVPGKNGGDVIAPKHAMPNDIPKENIPTFLDAVQNQK